MNTDNEKKSPIDLGAKIKSFAIVKESADNAPIEASKPTITLETIETTKRPSVLDAKNYKISSPEYEHAYYVSVSNITLNEGTPDEETRPYEIFINTKDKVNVQWVHALTFMMSAIFRKGGDYMFLIDELKEVSASGSGWFGQTVSGTSRYIESMVSAIADAVDHHVKTTCGIEREKVILSDIAQEVIAEKKAKHLAQHGQSEDINETLDADNNVIDAKLPGAFDCPKCNVKNAVVLMDGCKTCTQCGDSKCG
jgi:hypothetical protein